MIICFGDWGYGLTFLSIQSIIVEYLSQTGQETLFENGTPGKDWWYSGIGGKKNNLFNGWNMFLFLKQ